MIDLKEMPGMVEELRKILSSVQGAKAINETLSLEYVVEIEKEEHREAVEKVGLALSAQAEKFGFSLSVIPATTEEIQEAERKLHEHLASQSRFNA